jgi:hypothetical protein
MVLNCDICIYGATSGGVIAAVQAARMGKRVMLIEPGQHLGGMTSGGLGWVDHGEIESVGGLAREFFDPERGGVCRLAQDHGNSWNNPWTLTPGVAEARFREMIEESGVEVLYGERIVRGGGVEKELRNIRNTLSARISRMRLESGKVVKAKMFIDASYEGDLMAEAGVSWRKDREGEIEYGEAPLAGVLGPEVVQPQQFDVFVDPYLEAGNPESGLLKGIQEGSLAEEGTGDDKLQAYCFRLCLTNSEDSERRVEISEPKGYDPAEFEILRRYLKAREAAGLETVLRENLLKTSPVGDEKYDINNRGPFSIDYIGANWTYPESDYNEREAIWKDHIRYTKGLLWFLKSDPAVPESVRADMARFAWPADEFTHTNHFPHQLYIRECRRMVGPKVMTLQDLPEPKPIEDSIGMGSYGVDSHHVQRVIFPEVFADQHGSAGKLQNEGNFLASASGYKKGPYPIPYSAITPKAEECANLLVTFCVSASHVAFSSIRMEPVHMLLSQAAATVAVMAIEAGVPVQEVDVKELQERLIADGMVLER